MVSEVVPSKVLVGRSSVSRHRKDPRVDQHSQHSQHSQQARQGLFREAQNISGNLEDGCNSRGRVAV